MRITQTTLRQIIKEELEAVMNESMADYYMGREFDDGRSSVTGKPTFKERERERKRREAAKQEKDADAALMSMYAKSQMEEDLDEEIDEDMQADKARLRQLSKTRGPAARKAAKKAAEEAEFDERHLARLRALAAKRKEKEDREEEMRMASLGREEYPGERTSAVYREGSDAENRLKSLIVKVLEEREK